MKLKPIQRKNKKGQFEFSIGLFAILIIIAIIFAPIMIKVIKSVTGGMSIALNATNPEAVAQMNYAQNSALGFFDYLIVIGMFINVIILFISSYFIDTHPVFLLLYIFFTFLLMLFLPNMMDAVDKVWGKFNDTGIHSALPFTDWIRTHFITFMLAIIILNGIIMYAKFKTGENF